MSTTLQIHNIYNKNVFIILFVERVEDEINHKTNQKFRQNDADISNREGGHQLGHSFYYANISNLNNKM